MNSTDLHLFLYCSYCSGNGHSTQACPFFSKTAHVDYLEQLIPAHLRSRFEIKTRTTLYEGVGAASPCYDPENAACLENLIPNIHLKKYRVRSFTPIVFKPKQTQPAHIQITNTPEGVATALHKYGLPVSQKKDNNNYEELYAFVAKEGKVLMDQYGTVLGPEGLKVGAVGKKRGKK